jgi:hypothetical protein
MKKFFFPVLLFSCIGSTAQNVGIGEISPTAKLEVKSDGNLAGTNSLLIKNSDNNRLFHINGLGSSTFGNFSLANPGHIVGIHNGLLPSRAHLALYATGAFQTDPGAFNRIGFSNLNSVNHQFEIRSYTGILAVGHTLDLNYYDFTSPTPELKILSLTRDGSTNIHGQLRLNGSSGDAGQVLTSNGTSPPTWQVANPSIGFRAGMLPSYAHPGGVVILPYNNERFDDGFVYNPGTFGFTAPSSGLYHLQASVFLSGPVPPGTYQLNLTPPDGTSAYNGQVSFFHPGTPGISMSVSVATKLAAGEQVFVRLTAPAPVNIFNGASTFFSAYKVY